jgi:hypothetical protein
MRGNSSPFPYFVVLLLTIPLVVFAFWRTTSRAPFFYDEADYVFAGTRGLLNNYLDRPSLSTVDFVRKGLQLSQDRSQGANMSEFIRASGDITFYRHYHGPLYAYWIALCHAAGSDAPENYRASGLIIHVVSTLLIFCMFRLAFPPYPPIAALVAALTFLLNRTALFSATLVSQHILYTLIAAATLFLMALFCRDLDRRYWDGVAAALGLAFATVETSFVLLGAMLLTLALMAGRLGWRNLGSLLTRGILAFVVAILFVWPKGILQLGVLKGYLYLGYMAIKKRTFSPITPSQLWTEKFHDYPLEFVIPAIALIASLVFWRKLANRWGILPFLVYAWMFVAVMTVITLPFTHYHGSLLMSCAVVVGAIFGEIWLRHNLVIRTAAVAVLLVTLVGAATQYYGEKRRAVSTHDYRSDILDYLGRSAGMKKLYVPQILVPTVHFYHPELTTVAYDTNWSPAALAVALSQAGTKSALLCMESLCNEVRGQVPPAHSVRETQIAAKSEDLKEGPLNSLMIEDH